MDKIDLFLILAFPDQTRKYLEAVRQLHERERQGVKEHVSTMTRHLYVLSHLFNLRDFFAEEDEIARAANPVIYHIPYGFEDRQTGAEEALLRWKGKVPIVARVYDPHSPLKNSIEYLYHHHDLVLTYNRTHLVSDKFQFTLLAYDNHLVAMESSIGPRKKFCCMILGNKYNQDGAVMEGLEVFKHTHLGLRNIYPERDAIAQIREVDVYGRGWARTLPNYKGSLNPFDRKFRIASQYRFAVALENCVGRTYLSEKILDALLTLSVPVYLGAPDITDHVPKECFIDVRDYPGYRTLFDSLQTMPHSELAAFQSAMIEQRSSVFDRFSTARTIARPIYDWHAKRLSQQAAPVSEWETDMRRRLDGMRLASSSGGIREAVIQKLRYWKRRISG